MVIKFILRKIADLVPENLVTKLFRYKSKNIIISYSQCGEDILLANHLFNGQTKGFFVDIGAHHPRRYSNTKLLYDKGWSGINIDPLPSMLSFFQERRRDININMGVSNRNDTMNYYTFPKSPINTLEADIAREQEKRYGKAKITKIAVSTLREILDKYATNKKIDFMNIDVEGHELEVLESNDWNRYSPTVIALEDQNLDILKPQQSKTYAFLKEKGYVLFDKLNYTAFYKKQ